MHTGDTTQRVEKKVVVAKNQNKTKLLIQAIKGRTSLTRSLNPSLIKSYTEGTDDRQHIPNNFHLIDITKNLHSSNALPIYKHNCQTCHFAPTFATALVIVIN